MTTEELKQMKVDKTVDARGTSCPGPLLAAKKAIGEIEPGQVMEIPAYNNMAVLYKTTGKYKKGYEYLGTVEESGYFRIYMKK